MRRLEPLIADGIRMSLSRDRWRSLQSQTS
jgi:hypothetical protein